MEKNPVIIEFWGLQGGGKTTLCNQIKKHFDGRLKVCRVPDVIRQYHQEPLLRKILYLPFKSWIKLFYFLLSIPNKGKNEKDQYKSLFILTLAYTYFKNQKTYDILAVDHGLMQQLSSMLYVFDFQIKQKSITKWASFYNSLVVAFPVYCSICTETALDRMKLRNRSTGRIDIIMNEEERALYLLEKEKVFFDKVSNTLNDNIVLDMRQTPEELASAVVLKMIM